MAETPGYMAIAAELRNAVIAGEYPPGSRLPGEGEIKSRFGVQKVTAGRALRQLVDWGVAESRRGSGTYVRDFKPMIRDGIKRLGGETWPVGQSIWSADTEGRAMAVDRIHVEETGQAPAAIRAILQIDDDASVVIRSRRYVLDGKPVLLARSTLPGYIAAGTPIAQRDTGPGGMYARLAEMEHAPARFREDLRSLMPGPDVTADLEVSPGTPVVEIVRVAFDRNGVPVEVNEMTADASAYVFRYEFDA